MGELDAEVTDPRSRSIRVRDVLAMASGHTAETIDQVHAIEPVDMVRGFLLLPPEQEPGSVFAYNQPCTFTAAAIVQRASGDSLVDYLRPRLLDPLGIGEVAWQRDASGREIGYSGLHATTEAAAALGQVYVQEGRWGDRQLLSPEWVLAASRARIDTHEDGGPDWQAGYGFQFWRSAFGYRADGAYGQFSLIVPELELVVALTGQATQTQTLLSLAWKHLVPMVGRGSTSERMRGWSTGSRRWRCLRLRAPPPPPAATHPRRGRRGCPPSRCQRRPVGGRAVPRNAASAAR